MGQTLKVLNAVRFYEIGIPITYAECVVQSILITYGDLTCYVYMQIPQSVPRAFNQQTHRQKPTSFGSQDVVLSFFTAGPSSQALGMCQDPSVTAEREFFGHRRR